MGIWAFGVVSVHWTFLIPFSLSNLTLLHVCILYWTGREKQWEFKVFFSGSSPEPQRFVQQGIEAAPHSTFPLLQTVGKPAVKKSGTAC
jgi:hypothetical protein